MLLMIRFSFDSLRSRMYLWRHLLVTVACFLTYLLLLDVDDTEHLF